MRFPSRFLLPALLAAAAVGCASTKTVDLDEPRRVVGTENAVRIDAEVHGETLAPSQRLLVKYDITNQRPTPIAIADMVPEVSYDPETQIVTIGIGSEVPGERLLPRLIPIAPGEKKSFSASAYLSLKVPVTTPSPFARYPNALRLKVHFLGDTTPFEKLIAIPERAVADADLASRLFPAWIEKNETVYTNSLPMRWVGVLPEEAMAPALPARRRRGGG
ncbi:MAG TPA: hypothetical protein VNL91_02070 [Thermoanaerobaculia bacterium]|nr:hypothetical protein [Thermoanaerobaculia bacterium]